MNKLEHEMVDAIRKGIDWKKDNTEVRECPDEPGVRQVLLYGNEIARVRKGNVKVNYKTLAEWPTATTLRRLRALGVTAVVEDGTVMIVNYRSANICKVNRL